MLNLYFYFWFLNKIKINITERKMDALTTIQLFTAL